MPGFRLGHDFCLKSEDLWISGELRCKWGTEIKCHIYGTPWHSVLMSSLYFCYLNVVYLIVSFCWFSVNLTWFKFFFPNVRDDSCLTVFKCYLAHSWSVYYLCFHCLCFYLWIWVLLEFSDLILLSVFLSNVPFSTYFLFYFEGQRLGVFCVFSSVCCSSSTPSGFDWAVIYSCFLSLCWVIFSHVCSCWFFDFMVWSCLLKQWNPIVTVQQSCYCC